MNNESNSIKRPVGGGYLKKNKRNANLLKYYLAHPYMTHQDLARIFKISRPRVTKILKEESINNSKPIP